MTLAQLTRQKAVAVDEDLVSATSVVSERMRRRTGKKDTRKRTRRRTRKKDTTKRNCRSQETWKTCFRMKCFHLS